MKNVTRCQVIVLKPLLTHICGKQIQEADAAASRQQSKIDELEAQLHEAEDIVKDLREELGIIRDELYYMRKNRPQQTSEQQASQVVIPGQEAQREEIAPSISGFDHNQVLEVQAINVAESEMGNLFDQRTNPSIPDAQYKTLKVNNFDMAPNVSLTKEFGSLINESSQKVHELTNEKFSNGDGLHGKNHFAKDDSTVRTDCENSGKSVTQTSSPEVHISERKSHNRAKQDRKSKKVFYLLNRKAYKRTFKKSKMSSSLRNSESVAKKVLKSLQKTYHTTSKAYPCPVVSSAVRDTEGLNNSGLLSIGLHGPIQPCSQSTPENDKSKIVNVSAGEENGSADSSVTCAADPEIACVPSYAISKSDESNADGSFHPKTERSIKFTFQRKRKKECMGSADENETLVIPNNVESNGNGLFNESSQPTESNENTLKELKRSSLKRMNVDKQNIKTSIKRVDEEFPTATEPKVIGILSKATRNSRRLAQIARQVGDIFPLCLNGQFDFE